MRFSLLAGLSALLYGTGIAAACSSNLLVDNFSKWSSHTNSLNSWTSDDSSMSTISAAGGVLSFKPKANSYFYETFPCQAATTNGYNSLQFSLKGPAGGSLTVELQTQTSCSSTSYTSKFFTVSGLTGATQTINIPLSSFAGANLNAITSIVWEEFSSTTATWQLSNIAFGCGGTTSSSSSSSSSSSRSSSSSAASSVSSSSSSRSSTASSVSSSSSSSSSATSASSSSSSQSQSSSMLSTSTTSASPSGTCSGNSGSTLLIDDWISQSRLTFLFYNAMIQPSSDDATMKSLVVGSPAPYRLTMTPTNLQSYFYSEFGCLNAQAGGYGGISLRIKAPAGTTFTVELSSGCGATQTNKDQTTAQLGWTFDGTEKLYTIPFSKFSGLDTTKLFNILFQNLNKAVVFGPMAFYCGTSGAEYIPGTSSTSGGPSSTVPAPSGTAPALVIDTFKNKNTNDLGFWHGLDDGFTATWGTNKITLSTNDPDLAFYTQVAGGGCIDFSKYKSGYLHIAYSGSTDYTISLQQHNAACDDNALPYPGTWDSLEAARYASNGNIYIPMSHFNIDFTKTIGFSFHGFFTTTAVSMTKIEIVNSVPAGVSIPSKLPSGEFVFKCKRPNSFAFAIDDGDPQYAQQVMATIKKANISVTFFTLGAALMDPSTNLSNVYKEMKGLGHQLALHSYTHPKMEGLPSIAAIDWEYQQDFNAMRSVFGQDFNSIYMRPPFGTEGARMRERWAVASGSSNPYIVEWSADIFDWLYAESATPEKQIENFQDNVNRGGDLVVFHYLYPSTISYLEQAINIAKATGKQLMRVDQCMMDPNAPPL